jgi:hypothetical protein
MSTFRVIVFACSNFEDMLTAYVSVFVVVPSISRICFFTKKE